MGRSDAEGATKENALLGKGLEYCSRLFEIEQKLEKTRGEPDGIVMDCLNEQKC